MIQHTYKNYEERACLNCGEAFKPRTLSQKYCCKPCARNYYTETYFINHHLNLNSGALGAVSELLVCADLISKGFQVFRSVAQSSDADILAERPGKIYRFEVRTGKYSLLGNVTYPSSNTKGKSVIAVTLSDRKIHYITNPEIHEMVSTYNGPYRIKGVEPRPK